jgi:hypothetical protein
MVEKNLRENNEEQKEREEQERKERKEEEEKEQWMREEEREKLDEEFCNFPPPSHSSVFSFPLFSLQFLSFIPSSSSSSYFHQFSVHHPPRPALPLC